MHLSAPIYRLKRNARDLARQQGIPLHRALDRVASEQGYQSWSHLASQASQARPAAAVLSRLVPGDLILIGARPGQGKTLLGLELAARAGALGRTGFFFTLDYHERDVRQRLSELGLPPSADAGAVQVDTSDDISADHVIRRLASAGTPALAVIDYLQLLDQKRSTPDLATQIGALRRHVKETGAICAIISQIDRSFDLSPRKMPGRSDIRLPNPLDLAAFDRICFLNEGRLRMEAAQA
ncbi:DNA helicase [Salipiger abyssi]|uniref:AAA domain-containing protein n=1 Tax=Salipiger abyssi TaxID=1250539 RepID=A0A1P8V0C6_9RHOB|nr:DNA helicase [Salipiger abyssi]APZ55091.1 AAA domain-containing protein [Salipiger abyssi]